MDRKETKKLTLRFYDNIGRVTKTKPITFEQPENKKRTFATKNFIEFYIDDKSLINEIGKKFWNKINSESFFDNHIGFIGAFNEETDLLFVAAMLKLESNERLMKFIKRFASFEVSEERSNRIVKEIKANEKEVTLIYGCPCGDTGCGGIGAEINRDEHFYYWMFGEDENRLSYKFDSEEYENEFIDYLKRRIPVPWHQSA